VNLHRSLTPMFERRRHFRGLPDLPTDELAV
jgi:hypothetical protein